MFKPIEMKLAPIKYICSCGAATVEYVWDNEVKSKKVKCKCGKTLTNKNIPEPVQLVAIRTDTKNR